MTLGLPPDRARGGYDPLIRRSGQVVQERPLVVVRWADIPHLSAPVGRCLVAWQQYWQQSAGIWTVQEPMRISSSARVCPDRFELDQRPLIGLTWTGTARW